MLLSTDGEVSIWATDRLGLTGDLSDGRHYLSLADAYHKLVKEACNIIKARYGGFIPDIFKAMANDPEYLASLNEHMARVLAPRKVDARTKEVIAFVVAAMNACDFCLNAHSRGLRRHGYDDEAIAEILAAAALWSEVNRFNIGARVSWPRE